MHPVDTQFVPEHSRLIPPGQSDHSTAEERRLCVCVCVCVAGWVRCVCVGVGG